jgi:hypothetical protein
MPAFTLPADSDLSAIAIFNVLDTSYGGGMSPTRTGSQNATALQAAINAAQAAGGGMVLIPSINGIPYKIQGTIYIGTTPTPIATPLVFSGTAQGTKDTPLLQKVLDTGQPDNTDLFFVDTNSGGDKDIGGIIFQNLQIEYISGATSGAAIHVAAGQNVRILRSVFQDCPQAVWFRDTLQCSIFECTATYNHNTPAPSCIQLGDDASGVAAKEIYIASCTFLASGIGGNGLVIEGAEHIRVMNVRLEGFSQGINITPGAPTSGGQNTLKHHFGNVTVFTYNPSGSTGPAVTIQPLGSQNVSEIVFAECTFEPSANGVSLGPGVFIDEGAYGATVTDIRFVSCRVTRWTGPGIEITSGSNIEIVGGLYAANASGSNPSGGSGGVSITGPATGIRIVGAACIGTYPYVINQGAPTTPPAQDVGIYIAGAGASNVIIDHCDLTGNSQHAVLIGSGGLTVSNVFIRNCNANGYGTLPINAIDVVGQVSNVQITACVLKMRRSGAARRNESRHEKCSGKLAFVIYLA